MYHLLLPTDFSENSFRAAEYAVGLFGVDGIRYTLLHTYFDADPTISGWSGIADEVYKAAMQGMEDWAARVRKLEGLQGGKVATEVRYGPLTGVLNEVGDEHGADLVVMGTLGRSGAGLLGSNAVSVVKHGKLPVIVVPGRAKEQAPARILFADDQRGMDATDLQVLLALARHRGLEVVLAHVLRTGDEEPDQELIEEFEALFQGIPHRYVAEQGRDIAAVIDSLAMREEADLIAVLHRHVGFLEGLFHTSTAKRLALYTDTPLLVLRDSDQA